MDSMSVYIKYTKYKKYLIDLGLVIAILVLCTGMIFIGVVIGESTARNIAEKQRIETVESYKEIIKTKDDIIIILSQSTAKASEAVATLTVESSKNSKKKLKGLR